MCTGEIVSFYFYSEIRVKENKLIGSIPSWGPIFKISFDLKVLSFVTCSPDGVANYLTFTATDNDCCKIGDRIPAFFTNSGGFLQLATQINENGNLVKSSPQLEENIWYKVEVEQFKEDKQVIKDKKNILRLWYFQFFFVLRANGREVFREMQKNPENFRNVKIYAGKNSPANAVIRNFSYESRSGY